MRRLINKFNDKLFKQLFKKGVVVLLFRFLGLLFGFLFTVLVGKNYGPETLGIVALILSLINIFSLVSKVGLDMAFLNFATQLKKRGQALLIANLFWKTSGLLFALGVSFCTILWIFNTQIANTFFSTPEATKLVFITILFILPYNFLMFISEGFRVLKKMGWYAFFNATSVPLFACLIFFWLDNFFKDSYYVIFYRLFPIAGSLLLGFCILIFNLKLFKISKKNSIQTAHLFKYGSSVSISNSVGIIMQHSGIILLGVYASESEVGIYKIVISLSLLTNLMLVAISNASAPLYTEAFEENNVSKIKEISQKSVKIIFWTSLPVLTLFLLLPKYILAIIDPSFKEGWIALLILTISQFFNAISGSVGVILNMTNKQKVRTNTAIVSGVLSLILSFLLIPFMGINGAAISFAIASCLWNVLGIIYIKKYYRFNTLYLPVFTR